MIFGGGILLTWFRRRGKETFRVGRGELPPLWAGRLGAAVLLRGGAIGSLLTLGFLFAALDYASLRLFVVPLSNVPLLLLAYIHLLKPQGLTFRDGFGLTVAPGKAGRLVLAVVAVVAAGLLGEWAIGRLADPLNLSGFVAALPRAPVPPSRRLVFRNGAVVAAETGAGIDWRTELTAAGQRRVAELLAPNLSAPPPLRRAYGWRRR